MKKEILITISRNLPPDELIQLVQVANRFESYILLKQADIQINAKGMLGILHLLDTTKGAEMSIIAEGKDAEYALESLGEFLSI